jgi:hypothetical protein
MIRAEISMVVIDGVRKNKGNRGIGFWVVFLLNYRSFRVVKMIIQVTFRVVKMN